MARAVPDGLLLGLQPGGLDTKQRTMQTWKEEKQDKETRSKWRDRIRNARAQIGKQKKLRNGA